MRLRHIYLSEIIQHWVNFDTGYVWKMKMLSCVSYFDSVNQPWEDVFSARLLKQIRSADVIVVSILAPDWRHFNSQPMLCQKSWIYCGYSIFPFAEHPTRLDWDYSPYLALTAWQNTPISDISHNAVFPIFKNTVSKTKLQVHEPQHYFLNQSENVKTWQT